jgi:hypothetical protein
MTVPRGCRLIAGQDGKYAVNGLGGVWSCTWSGSASGARGGSHIGPWRKLKPRVGLRGYLQIKLARGKTFYVHDLVLEAFVGARPRGKEACHGPGGRLDNRLANLRWDSHVENMADALRAGAIATKLTPAKVRAIRRAATKGTTQKTLAAMCGVGGSTIGSVVRRRTWKHVK